MTVRPDARGEEVLCAYCVATDTELDWRDIRHHLAEYLPTFMIPSYFAQVQALTLSPNGKVDVTALPEPRTYDETEDAPDRGHESGLLDDHRAQLAGRGAERESKPNLARALNHVVREHAVEAERREQRGEHGKAGRQRGDEPVEIDVVLHLPLERREIAHG